ncbi:long-chain-fatty-acid--CoA ligase LcfB [Thermoclostridium stercorarium subsp. stercorarium DSM 8532]|uniref:Long-chain-fatty-acid--CoA ligase LcfB n=2 Tax=Thermoclostridium stercorarium TaxID=1510 RepID=L7VT13_THES1|nr:AMP-binding protein [Thermoclostridium stercorarium]AGC68658.1 long-chain-fatty-acid--CoA ligase LcfB [Thermoclostridium stercorarium subsp. stercorarium DSM 8532]AGI39671.1 acyl-CoA synthetase [Thermoclostridium stercorarium subsp. stercorarium DSM 8532]ANW98997.1 AMP-dependent synthetase [Thermoclostridium stercorarium subsp. thermolacticum DSM 2910]UZQ84641.1 AMP-binding protein [Thermoclostridium stercorarium]
MPITEFLERNARLYGDEKCLTEINMEVQGKKNVTWLEYELIENSPSGSYRREMTWREFDEKANRLANLLLKRGIKKGDKVAILLMNCIEWLPIYFGILKAGAVAVPLNFRYTAEEIRYCLNLSDAVALIFGPEFTERIELIYQDIPAVKMFIYVGEKTPSFAESYERLTAVCPAEAPKVDISDDDDAAIYYSSGTTGFPKAILHAHRSLVSACYTEQKHHGQTREDNFLCIPPLYHTGAKMHWFGSLISGSRAVLLRGVKPEWILKTVSEEKITIVWLLVPWAQDILDAIERGDINLHDYDLSSWRLMHIGAQPVPPSLICRWKKYFPNHLYDTNYGLSESTGPGCVHLGVENIHKVGAIGKPGYNWEAKIVDEDGNPVPQGEIGELAVKGPGVMKCYYKDPKATEEVLKDGWLLTGDMARMDEDGFIYLVDRKKDVIISGGENIYPVQVEDFLRAHNGIKDAAVIGLPDRRQGEIVAAIIETKPGINLTEKDIIEYCRDLPRYKRPRKIIFDKVPRNPTGKIEKPLLRAKYGATQIVATQTQL